MGILRADLGHVEAVTWQLVLLESGGFDALFGSIFLILTGLILQVLQYHKSNIQRNIQNKFHVFPVQ